MAPTTTFDEVKQKDLKIRITKRLTWLCHLLYPRVPLCISSALRVQVRRRPLIASDLEQSCLLTIFCSV
jgi:hypothetical protein